MKRFRNILTIIVSFGLFLYLLCKPAALPTTDLASPSQEVRDAAAKILRSKAKQSMKVKWFFLVHRIKAGQTPDELLKFVRAYNPDAESEPSGGLQGGFRGSYYAYHLDGYWALECHFSEQGNLDEWKLTPRWRYYFVRPATNFTGAWINYYANGQKFTVDFFHNGQRHRECLTYFPDSMKSSVENYDDGKANGMMTRYFPSGQIQSQTLYSNHAKVGEAVRFYTNGCPERREYYSNGQRNGPMTIYFPSGKIKTSTYYKNGEKVGLEITYNEDGTTNSVVDRSHQ
ncbi:MAG: toxin-antitoxin system YwqK family antitoxin [Verrucomicrobiota bacterium]